MHAFQSGRIEFQPKFIRSEHLLWPDTYNLKNFDNYTSILPFTLQEAKDLPLISNNNQYHWNVQNLERISLRHGKWIPTRKLNLKKVAIIYNPNSGKKTDIRDRLLGVLGSKKIGASVFKTKGYMDAWHIASSLRLANFDALIAVGGDGTLHEVVNGMMFRQDRAKIPIAFVPNGSGNDTCKSIGVWSI